MYATLWFYANFGCIGVAGVLFKAVSYAMLNQRQSEPSDMSRHHRSYSGVLFSVFHIRMPLRLAKSIPHLFYDKQQVLVQFQQQTDVVDKTHYISSINIQFSSFAEQSYLLGNHWTLIISYTFVV
jgi:hypothetical protein